jgi:hypothetical protein
LLLELEPNELVTLLLNASLDALAENVHVLSVGFQLFLLVYQFWEYRVLKCETESTEAALVKV